MTVTDEYVMLDQRTAIGRRHQTYDLIHERVTRMGVDPSTCTRREARSMTNTV